jgi:2-polyprenyl-3-methyl-5-hydroxy-6-metoxy-1,4-benzoquinol methylase
VKENTCIATEEISNCLLCGNAGSRLYESLRDRLFGVPGEWGFCQCTECSFVWLNPRPVPTDLNKVYKTYFTHGENGRSALRGKCKRALYSSVPGYGSLAPSWFWKLLSRGLTLSSLMKERALLGTMCLTGNGKGRLLDVGCGDGEFLAIMREAGWDVMGVEPDPISADLAARRHGFPVSTGSLQEARFPDAFFDAITLGHVIEHVYDPVGLLFECSRVLAATGRVVITTPNIESRGHEIFRGSWVALDPPRHVFLFSSDTLRRCCEKAGLDVQVSKTSTRNARWNWTLSRGSSEKCRSIGQIRALSFLLEEEHRVHEMAGEELVYVAAPSKSPHTDVNGERCERPICQVY